MALSYLAFLGSTRDSAPPRPARLGLRVARACMRLLEQRGAPELIDPLDWPLPQPFKPHFSYAQNMAPPDLEALAAKIRAADAFVMISPEYNHSMSPALANLLNHFGSSHFSWKPSLIVTYSAGQWGGTRAAMAMRPFLSELGCLPVSAMVHVPEAHSVFDEDGAYLEGNDGSRWDGYIGRGLDQLAWWAEAAADQRDRSGEATGAFVRDPSQRNAP
ncbi:NAD(P)H-dependent oxidoreductase [Sphingomonas rhizophila]|uniref:NAD(P)H-dependent oxidoreductase n=2 Tax=Sphingomonas rhizophila TaxID=2071607 RepID=A0A7G9SCN1_9SPHN|nr:NAD(P)H-dependent oxidoreductase [Sphingomonas rhizophila]QNN65606.1 NAD(P)H-dependent oxidoreductase [Sphingomonas rhizophila]